MLVLNVKILYSILMTIELSDSQEQKLNALLASGKFNSKEAILEFALETLAQNLKEEQSSQGFEDFKSFLMSMPVGLEDIERDELPSRTVEL